jgi:hypothetical protein
LAGAHNAQPSNATQWGRPQGSVKLLHPPIPVRQPPTETDTDMLERTSTDYAPWYLLPCDKKWYARMAVNELLNEALKALDLSWPPADFDLEAERARVAAL